MAFHANRDVFTQQRIGDFALPALRQRPIQIAHHHLIEQDAQRVDVALHGERLAHQRLGRRVNAGAGAAGFVALGQIRGHVHHRDVALGQLRRIGQHPDAEVRQSRARHPGVIAVNQNVRGLDVLVQHTHRVGRGDGHRGAGDNVQPRRQIPPWACDHSTRLPSSVNSLSR